MIKYKEAKKIMKKHDMTLIDRIIGFILYPILFYKWYKIAKNDNIKLREANKDYWRLIKK